MEDPRQTIGPTEFISQQRLQDKTAPAEDFFPLRLLTQPGALCIELTMPDMLIGRHSEADVRLALPDVSRRHCRFVFADGQWQVFDLNSLNGVFVNGLRLTEATLCQGDLVRIGSLTLMVDLEGSEPQAQVIRSFADVLSGEEQEHRKAS
jgi:pSer/pThr/pTyr-binding forkhead associated (FHA) protein